MKRRPLKLLALAAALSFVGVAAARAGGDSKEKALAEVEGYKGWRRVTLKPLPIEALSLGG